MKDLSKNEIMGCLVKTKWEEAGCDQTVFSED